MAAEKAPTPRLREKVRLYRYNPETMLAPDTTVVVVGPRGSGKTVFMKYVMFCMRSKFDLVTFFCPSRDVRQEFEAFMPKTHIHSNFSKTALKQVVDAQATLAAQCPNRTDVGTGGVPLRNLALVLDDCMAKKTVFECETVRSIMNNGRHDNIFFMNGVQYIMAVPKEQRSQIDVAVCFPHSGAYLKNVNENLMGDAFEDVNECADAFGLLKEHECLVYDARAKRNKRPFLFYCKALYDLPDFMVGCDFFWRMYYRHMVRSKVDAHKEILNTVALAQGKPAPDTINEDGEVVAGCGAEPGVRVVVRMPPTALMPMVTGPAAKGYAGNDVGAGTGAATGLRSPPVVPAPLSPMVKPKKGKKGKKKRKGAKGAKAAMPLLALKSIL